MNDHHRLLEAFARDAGAGIPEMTPADEILAMLPHFDYPAQLAAVRELLRRERAAEADTTRAIQALESAPASQQAADERVDRLHASVYQDAAHSMAAVGMLAPLAESLFRHSLIAIGERYSNLGLPIPAGPRFTKSRAWDPKNNGNRGFVAGIREICDAADILPFLPPETVRFLDAVFAYRNAMFHNGLEWPPDERADFRTRAGAWPDDWFEWSETAGEPWIGYMTDSFVDGFLGMLEDAIDGLGRFARSLASRADKSRSL
jgi:hypothetical protein